MPALKIIKMSILRALCSRIRLFLDIVIDFIFSLYWECKNKKLPDLDEKHAYLADSAVSLAQRIKSKQLKSEDLVKALIERIKQVNPILNAVVTERYEDALNEAREVDRQVSAGLSEQMAKKPFLGVPFTMKESQAWKGMPLTLGLWSRRNERAVEDSEAIIRLREAGAIPLAATNLPELLIWQETRNPVYGMTVNPQHTGRTPGGSSGAEAALTATYATSISLCSDIGGSTRMPAFYCGMFGHHPTANTTCVRGVLFREGNEDSMFCLGFISRHVEDLVPLTKIITAQKADKLNLDRKINLRTVKFYYLDSSNDCLVSPLRSEMTQAIMKVVENLRGNLKVEVQPYHHKGFDYMYRLWSYWMSKEAGNYFKLATNSDVELNAWAEMGKKAHRNEQALSLPHIAVSGAESVPSTGQRVGGENYAGAKG
ncbi:fatty-acid amide hydrolase 2-like isoform X3 [Pieris napi]|uniref:fatty-acid amide hydrolase 2-like isoform X3 n=1 Tax=Pieris napi TaxID=78633 RepID=UPI001FBBBD02|nr:fatty-acid amide hydrolase 2-like isoform X3 [Pieris napi]